jgi:formylglycine-generating enzyme required for sulfatase activity
MRTLLLAPVALALPALLVLLPALNAAPAPVESRKKLTNSIGMRLVLIPAGKFPMGSPKDDPDELKWKDAPQHEVEITRAFYMGACTVTQKQYKQVMGTNPSFFSRRGDGKEGVKGLDTDEFPVEQVSWENACEFCQALSKRPAEKGAGRVYRLPTEAEWEYACRAGTTTPFHSGKSLTSRQANIGYKIARPCKVGSYKPNAWGLYDMPGNVWQFCADFYERGYYKKSPRTDPQGPADEIHRVIRGGSWRYGARICGSAFRARALPADAGKDIGFRVVCVVRTAR